MSDVVSGLLAKLDELEAEAGAAARLPAAARGGAPSRAPRGFTVTGTHPAWKAWAAANGPEATLRLCRAHRDIIELYQRQYDLEASGAGQSTGTQGVLVYAVALLEDVVTSLARGLGVEEQGSE